MEAVLADTREKDLLLSALGFNVNLSPVADVSTNPADFMYDRTFGQDAAATADYVAQVVSQMAEDGMGSVLKHFPGYGNNVDTHTGIAVDQRRWSPSRPPTSSPSRRVWRAAAERPLCWSPTIS